MVAALDADEPRIVPDRPLPGSARVGNDPTEGHLVAIAGHRPPELGGYQENPISLGVRRKLIDILRAKKELHPDLAVATGLGLGAEMLGAEAAAAAGVPYVAVLAFEVDVRLSTTDRDVRPIMHTVRLNWQRP